MDRLDYLRKKLADIIQEILFADDDVRVDSWRSVAIFQNGFAWREHTGEGLNQLFRTDLERARIKMDAFQRAESEHLEKGDFGNALGFGLRAVNVRLDRVASTKRIHLMVDSTGLSIVGEGEWAAVKHGGNGKRAWKKLHLGVDRSGVIVAELLTDGNAGDSNTALALLGTIEDDIASFTADSGYDTIAIYDAAEARNAKVIVPPRRTATRSRRSSSRDRTVRRVKKVGRRQWRKESGYHQQARVENTFFRYKSIVGDRLRARHPKSQEVEALIACNTLNRMMELGRPESFAIGA